ncbi:MAG TPA: pyridoxal-phosphate dependent enzyme [Acidimicrobiales bacterium]|nr:pyridoxal-phosphate dependent enzyme [Acidimicrobiales bacterium]
MKLVDRAAVEGAEKRLSGLVHRTPVVTCGLLDDRAGAPVFLKAEVFQKTGSFKIRGALNKTLQLSDEEKQRGVVTLSAGNAAGAVALAARMAGVSATVVMPAGAVRAKVDAVRGYGGEVVLAEGDLIATYEDVRDQRGLVPVHPFDDLEVIAGAGTVGLEFLEDAPDIDVVVVGVGGGGLISGVAAAMHGRGVRVVGVEPVGASLMAKSVAAGAPLRDASVATVADGLRAPMAGEVTLPHVQALVDELVQIEDEPIIDAVRLLATRAKLVVEPAGAAGLAAVLSGAVTGKKIGVLLSGGNLDLSLLA